MQRKKNGCCDPSRSRAGNRRAAASDIHRTSQDWRNGPGSGGDGLASSPAAGRCRWSEPTAPAGVPGGIASTLLLRRSGPLQGDATLFLMVLGASSYTYAEATLDQQMAAWLRCHIHAFEYFQAMPRLLVPDNTRTAVSRACRYDPDLNPTYQEMAMYYGIGVVPTRPYQPRDKAKVESGVLVAERWIIAALRHRTFFRLEDLNRAIRELLENLNHRRFKKRDGSRASVFENVERAAMLPLPAEPFDMSQWSHARVNIDYHIAFDHNFYSVRYRLIGEPVEVRSTPITVEIFHKGKRVASHPRGRGREQAITQNEHRPKSHQAHLEWTPTRMVHWAEQIGPNTARLIERILSEKPHPEMGYRSCLGIIRLAERVLQDRFHALEAAGIALQGALGGCFHACRRVARPATARSTPFVAATATARQHSWRRVLRVRRRGRCYCKPMMEKLQALKLQGWCLASFLWCWRF